MDSAKLRLWAVAGVVSGLLAASTYSAIKKYFSRRNKRKTNGLEDDQLDSGESTNLLNLLYSIAEDQAKKDGIIHKGVSCNNCNASPIRGHRFKCLNCVDYDLCETCEAADLHIPIHVFCKFRIPTSPFANPRDICCPPFYGEGTNNGKQVLSWESLKLYEESTEFDIAELQSYYVQFAALCSEADSMMSFNDFKKCFKCLSANNSLLIKRIFKVFDIDNDDELSFSDVIHSMSVMYKGSLQDKCKMAFKVYDITNCHAISKQNMIEILLSFHYINEELIADVFRVMQAESLGSFNESDNRPVSAAFMAGIGRRSAEDLLEKYPLDNVPQSLRTLTVDAIEEYVDRIFEASGLKGDDKMPFENFLAYCETDTQLLVVIESIGGIL